MTWSIARDYSIAEAVRARGEWYRADLARMSIPLTDEVTPLTAEEWEGGLRELGAR